MKMVEIAVEAKKKKITQEEFDRLSPAEKKRIIDQKMKDYRKFVKKEKERYNKAYENWCKNNPD